MVSLAGRDGAAFSDGLTWWGSGPTFNPTEVAMRDEALLRKIAEAIWSTKDTPMRLLDEISRPDTNLNREQRKCWKEAGAVYETLFN